MATAVPSRRVILAKLDADAGTGSQGFAPLAYYGTQSQSARAHLYPDLPLAELQKSIPSLEGLRPAANQAQLQSILDKMAGTVANFVPRLPDIISREDVFREEDTSGATAPQQIISLTRSGSGPLTPSTIKGRSGGGEEYRYLIICHRAPNGTTSLEEARTDRKGHPLTEKQNGRALGSGFAYQWLLFGAANQSEFRFSLIGEQRIDERETFVLAFAQIPAEVKFPAVFKSGDKQAPYYISRCAEQLANTVKAKQVTTRVGGLNYAIGYQRQSVILIELQVDRAELSRLYHPERERPFHRKGIAVQIGYKVSSIR